MALKQKDVLKLTKEEALKKLDELRRALLETEQTSQKRKPIKKAIARLNTYIHRLAGSVIRPADKPKGESLEEKKEKVKAGGKKKRGE